MLLSAFTVAAAIISAIAAFAASLLLFFQYSCHFAAAVAFLVAVADTFFVIAAAVAFAVTLL